MVSFQGTERSARKLGRGWKLPLGSLIVTLMAGYFSWALLQTSSVTLDRQSGTYVVDSGRVFFVPALASGPLSDIANAALETDQAGQRFVLVLQDGQRIGLGAFSDKGRQSEAVAAVNHFLQANGSPRE
jgi:hypothetical protein